MVGAEKKSTGEWTLTAAYVYEWHRMPLLHVHFSTSHPCAYLCLHSYPPFLDAKGCVSAPCQPCPAPPPPPNPGSLAGDLDGELLNC